LVWENANPLQVGLCDFLILLTHKALISPLTCISMGIPSIAEGIEDRTVPVNDRTEMMIPVAPSEVFPIPTATTSGRASHMGSYFLLMALIFSLVICLSNNINLKRVKNVLYSIHNGAVATSGKQQANDFFIRIQNG